MVKVVIIVGSQPISRIADSTRIIRSLSVALDLDSDIKFRIFNHREELDSAVQLPNFKSFRWHAALGACYIIL